MSEAKSGENTYDQIPYESRSFPQTHPIRLATVATLFGIDAPSLDGARVLELGCAGGGNLLPLAEALPACRFVGVDYSKRQVDAARGHLEELDLVNVELRHASIADIDEDFGEFDYIICHGVYSWVPDEVQRKILKICRTNLAPCGVAYVSYNTYPGWHMRGMIRDMMLFHIKKFEDNAQRIQQARALLDFLAESTSKENAYGILLKAELETLRNQSDSYLFHEHLEEFNEPLYFHQFVERAAAEQLVYLGEADPAVMWSGNFADKVQEKLSEVHSDVIQSEQYMDFLRNRTFRQTLLVHAGQQIDRTVQPEDLVRMHVASNMKPQGDAPVLTDASSVEFRGSGAVTLTTSIPLLKMALAGLGERWPQSIAVDELAVEARKRLDGEEGQSKDGDPAFLAGHLGRCYLANMAEFHVRPFEFASIVAERPQVSPIVRLQAKAGHVVTNRRHEQQRLDDFVRYFVRLLDGSRDARQLLEEIVAGAQKGDLNLTRDDGSVVDDEDERRGILEQAVPQALELLAKGALLVPTTKL